jgi:hypothetical protein
MLAKHLIEDDIQPGQKVALKPERAQDTPYKQESQYYTIIERECSDYVAACKATGKVLYRGVNSHVGAFMSAPWKERIPMSTKSNVQKDFDDGLSAAGFTALRSNSIYATSKIGTAGKYSPNTYVIAPRNDCNFTWSRHIEDFWVFMQQQPAIGGFTPEDDGIIRFLMATTGALSVQDLFKDLGFKKDDLAGAINSGNEVYISGIYYAFSTKKFPGIVKRLTFKGL